MDKRRLHHIWTRVRGIKPWYFLIAAVVCGILCVFTLRANNLHMVRLREAVYTADKNNGNTEEALRSLRSYVYAHMNTNLASGPNAVHPPIQLKYTYERLIKAQSVGSSNNNSEIYNQAQKYCEQAIPNGVSGSYRLSCIQAYVKQHGIAIATVQSVPRGLYQFDFVSAAWSPDLAGWSLVATVFLLLCALGSWLFNNVIRHMLSRHLLKH